MHLTVSVSSKSGENGCYGCNTGEICGLSASKLNLSGMYSKTSMASAVLCIINGI